MDIDEDIIAINEFLKRTRKKRLHTLLQVVLCMVASIILFSIFKSTKIETQKYYFLGWSVFLFTISLSSIERFFYLLRFHKEIMGFKK